MRAGLRRVPSELLLDRVRRRWRSHCFFAVRRPGISGRSRGED